MNRPSSMTPEAHSAGAMQTHIKAIIRLDCQSLPAKLDSPNQDHYSATPYRKSSRMRIASLPTIRALLVSCSELAVQLQGIARIVDLKQYAEFRRPLLQRVLPDSLCLFEYCQEIMGLKGAVNTPVAEKLATVAHQVCDLMDTIRLRVNTALEYHDLKINILGEIREFITSPECSEKNLDALFFSLEQILPQRIESFSATAMPTFARQVALLKKMRNDLLGLAKSRAKELRQEPPVLSRISEEPESSASDISAGPKLIASTPKIDKASISPYRIKIPVLRGFKHRQQLSENHVRIVSRSEMDRMMKLKSPRQTRTALNPRLPLNSGRDENIDKENTYQNSSIGSSKSRIRPPTRIENRKVSGPTWKELYGAAENNPDSERRASINITRPVIPPNDSRIPKPTELRSISRSRASSFGSNYNWGDRTSFNSSFDTSSIIASPHMMLSSPDTSFVAETPLASKSSIPHMRHRMPFNELHIPRKRASALL